MIVADTNVWARAYLNDDAVQASKARKALAEARGGGGVFVPLIVLAELAWVLRAKWTADRVLSTLEALLQTGGVAVEEANIAQAALEATRAGNGGFADHLIALTGFAHGGTEIITFDEKFGKTAKVRLLN